MAGDMLTWRFFDVEAETLPETLSAGVFPLGGRGRIVVLAATSFARAQGWAERAAVALARGWAAQGLRIFMMDLALEDPALHEAVGVRNTEGVADAFLFGASIERIAQASPDGSFFFASAGTFPPDPAEVLSHPRWNDLAGGFSEALATLVLFLPTTVPGADRILSRATDIVFLAGQGEAAEDHLGPAAVKVVAVVGPVGSLLSPPTPFPPATAAPGASHLRPPWLGEEVEAAADRAEGGPPGWSLPRDTEAEPAGPAPTGGELTGVFDTIPDWGGGGGAAAGSVSALPVEEGLLTDGEFELSREFLSPVGEEIEGGEGGGRQKEGLVSEPSKSDPPGGKLPPVEPWFGPEDGTLVLEGAEEGGGGVTPRLAPEFPADFVELPPVPEDRGGFEDLLIPGPDFGSPAPPPAAPGGSSVRAAGLGSPPAAAEERDVRMAGLPPSHETQAERRAPAGRTPALPPRRPPPAKKRFRVAVAMALVVLVAVGTVAAAALGYLNVPALTFFQDIFGRLPKPALVNEGPQATGPVLHYSLRLFDYREEQLQGAKEILEILRSRLPGHLFHLAYQEGVGGRRLVVLAGIGADREEVEGLRASIAAVLPREDPAAWRVLETPRGFFLGKYSSLEEAWAYLRSVEARGIPAYILSHTFDDGTSGYGVWVGAYAGVEDALLMQRVLRRAGFPDVPLLERRGRVPE